MLLAVACDAVGMMPDIHPDSEALAGEALEWLLGQAREAGDGLAWPGRTAGSDDEGWELSSLYLGLAGRAFVLSMVGDMLGDRAAAGAAARALDVVRSRFDGERWSDQFELLAGNAGIALGAARAGDLDLAVMAVTPYLATAEPTPGGVQWEVRAGVPARFHHISHGTLGIVCALAAVGHAAGRDDLIGLALEGAVHATRLGQLGPVRHEDHHGRAGFGPGPLPSR